LDLEGLEGADRLGPASQEEVSNGATTEIRHLFSEAAAHANTGAERLVGRLQARSNIDGVAIGAVIEEPSPAEIAHDSSTRMCSDPGVPEWNSLPAPAVTKRRSERVEFE